MTEIAIIGAGGHGKVAADTALSAGYTDIVFLDDAFPERTECAPWTIVGASDDTSRKDRFIGIGDNAVREKLFVGLDLAGGVSLIHRAATISTHAKIGYGVLVVAGAIINVGTEIGDGVIINTGSTVDHDCKIGPFSHISPGAHLAGGVTVGHRSWVGAGAVIKEGCVIGDDVVIGAGAVVIRDVTSGLTVAGNPAQKIR